MENKEKPQEIEKKPNQETPVRRHYKNRYRTGEDIDMLRENNYERRRNDGVSICDIHEDGA